MDSNTDNMLRPDLRVIAELVPTCSRLLDIGCGKGILLAWLAAHKQVDGRGIEIDALKVKQAIASGVPVVQGDVNIDLADYPDNAYDIVVLSQALQAMLDPKATLAQLLRIGKKAIISIPNFGHLRVRLDLLLRGRMPVTKTLTYSWHDTPNIHFCTITDLVELCNEMGITIEKRLSVNHAGVPTGFSGRGFLANLLGKQGVFVLSKME